MTATAGLGDTGIAIISVFSIALGYVAIWALWHFIFSPRNEHDDQRDRAASSGLPPSPASSEPEARPQRSARRR